MRILASLALGPNTLLLAALAAPPTIEGLAVAGDRLFAAPQGGSLACLGN